MTSATNGVEPSDEGLLAEQPVGAYLADGESLQATLTNTAVGVSREDGDDGETFTPGADRGTVAAVTDGRLLFLVGDPDGHDGDHAVSVPYGEVAAVDTRDETLAEQLVVETTAGATWAFTAREVDELAAVLGDVEDRSARRQLERARDLVDAAASTGDGEDREDRVAALEEAVEAYRCVARLGCPGTDDPGTAREEAVAAIEDLLDAHVAFARDRRATGNWDYQAGDEAVAREAFDEALDSFDRAVGLAREYPVGDAEALVEKRDALAERRDEVAD